MNYKQYITAFERSASQLDKTVLQNKQIEVAVGEVLNSVFLKLYKTSWANVFQNPLTAETRIFFSVWINDSVFKDQKLFYNIHALKLRKLKGYTIQSRKFAAAFRHSFNDFKHKWKNVSVDFGPLTLMEGWLEMDTENMEQQITGLANNFLEIEHLIDNTLNNFRLS